MYINNVIEPVSVFLFCHQDDEFGVYQQILNERSRGNRVVCIYVTSGVERGGDPFKRNSESVSVLTKLGVHYQDVIFAGSILSISDSCLMEHMKIALVWLTKFTSGFSNLKRIYAPAWEGGHPDHDALHAIAVVYASNRGLLGKTRQYPLYNGYNCPWKFFRLAKPLSENGDVSRFRIPFNNRLRFLYCALLYPSQWKSWLGLYPFFIVHLLCDGAQSLQGISISRVFFRPHSGELYYEKRGFTTWNSFNLHLLPFLGEIKR